MQGRVGFWQLLLDDKISLWEAYAINKAHDHAEVAQGQASAAQFSIEQTNNRITQLSREVVMLRTALTVLTKTLLDTKVVDQRLLEARLEAAMDEAFAPAPGGEASQLRSITCIRCRIAKPPAQTTMTVDGPVCDTCARLQVLSEPPHG
jgi:hypothetical protein